MAQRNGGNKRGAHSTSYGGGVVLSVVSVRPAVNAGPARQSGRARGKAAAGDNRAARGLVRRSSSAAVAGGGNASGRVWPRLGRATRRAARGVVQRGKAIGAAVAGALGGLSAAVVLVRTAGAMATAAMAGVVKFGNIVTIGNDAAATPRAARGRRTTGAAQRAARGRKGRTR
jgi:hypothetical protein